MDLYKKILFFTHKGGKNSKLRRLYLIKFQLKVRICPFDMSGVRVYFEDVPVPVKFLFPVLYQAFYLARIIDPID